MNSTLQGELKGKQGLVPSNFLEDISEVESSTTSRSYSPSFNRNRENKLQNNQATKDKVSSPAYPPWHYGLFHLTQCIACITWAHLLIIM